VFRCDFAAVRGIYHSCSRYASVALLLQVQQVVIRCIFRPVLFEQQSCALL
jgi:hypothetical protein